jgi:hypothetical protein
MSELREIYEELARQSVSDYVPNEALNRHERLARGAGYIAWALVAQRVEPNFSVGSVVRRRGPGGSHLAFKLSFSGWILRKGFGTVDHPEAVNPDMPGPTDQVCILTQQGGVLHIVHTDKALEAAAIRGLPLCEVGSVADFRTDMLSSKRDEGAIWMIDDKSGQPIRYDTQAVARDLARLAVDYVVPIGM